MINLPDNIPDDYDFMPEKLENFALEWEADIVRYKDEPGPESKIIPREWCSRLTLERRIAFMRQAANEITALRQQIEEARAHYNKNLSQIAALTTVCVNHGLKEEALAVIRALANEVKP